LEKHHYFKGDQKHKLVFDQSGRQAIALLAAALYETLERHADHAFKIIRDEDEYIQKFEFRYASILLNKDLRSANGDALAPFGLTC